MPLLGKRFSWLSTVVLVLGAAPLSAQCFSCLDLGFSAQGGCIFGATGGNTCRTNELTIFGPTICTIEGGCASGRLDAGSHAFSLASASSFGRQLAFLEVDQATTRDVPCEQRLVVTRRIDRPRRTLAAKRRA
jgi:hypothetical protein